MIRTVKLLVEIEEEEIDGYLRTPDEVLDDITRLLGGTAAPDVTILDVIEED